MNMNVKIPAEVKPGLWGAAGGAALLAVIGFNWGGWVTGGTAEQMAKERSSSAVVTALAPICVNRFQQQTDPSASLVQLKKVSSWEQGTFVEKGGWATMPGSASADPTVARTCAEMLSALK